jgi:hypothetical protein
VICHGQDAGPELGGWRIFATHYLHYGRGMACTGDDDLVCCGHSHVPGKSSADRQTKEIIVPFEFLFASGASWRLIAEIIAPLDCLACRVYHSTPDSNNSGFGVHDAASHTQTDF